MAATAEAMATEARSGASRSPISSHPVFAPMVALWFAALFGGAVMVLPGATVERLVAALGIKAAIPAIAAPLGITAKLALAGIAAGLGALAGLLIARAVAVAAARRSIQVGRDENTRQPGAAPVKRPIVATEELGEEGFGPVDTPSLIVEEAGDPELGLPLPEPELERLAAELPDTAALPTGQAADYPAREPAGPAAALAELPMAALIARFAQAIEASTARQRAEAGDDPLAFAPMPASQAPAGDEPRFGHDRHEADPADTEQALREALDKLQRMSGAA